MEVNAPEKIYIDDPTGEFDDHWSIYQNNDSIEYIRTDALIEKALEWLCNNYDKYIRVIGSSIYPAYSELCRDFQNDMKGE